MSNGESNWILNQRIQANAKPENQMQTIWATTTKIELFSRQTNIKPWQEDINRYCKIWEERGQQYWESLLFLTTGQHVFKSFFLSGGRKNGLASVLHIMPIIVSIYFLWLQVFMLLLMEWFCYLSLYMWGFLNEKIETMRSTMGFWSAELQTTSEVLKLSFDRIFTSREIWLLSSSTSSPLDFQQCRSYQCAAFWI